MTAPRIYVLARPSFTKEYASFLSAEGQQWTTDGKTPAERLVEFSGRICYMAFGKRQSPRNNREYIQNLIVQGHESVLEHVSWTFLLTHVSRAFTHQLVRHRIGFSFSQLSQQYHDESEANFIPPEGLEEFPDALSAWKTATENTRDVYQTILSNLTSNQKISKETLRAFRTAARSVLPNATETKIVLTANARAIRHFLSVRGAIEGDIEMRRVSKLIYDVLVDDAPTLVADFDSMTLLDGSPKIVKSIS